MLTQGFFYCLLLCELAALGLLLTGIIVKVRSIRKNYYPSSASRNYEHNVPYSDQAAAVRAKDSIRSPLVVARIENLSKG